MRVGEIEGEEERYADRQIVRNKIEEMEKKSN